VLVIDSCICRVCVKDVGSRAVGTAMIVNGLLVASGVERRAYGFWDDEAFLRRHSGHLAHRSFLRRHLHSFDLTTSHCLWFLIFILLFLLVVPFDELKATSSDWFHEIFLDLIWWDLELLLLLCVRMLRQHLFLWVERRAVEGLNSDDVAVGCLWEWRLFMSIGRSLQISIRTPHHSWLPLLFKHLFLLLCQRDWSVVTDWVFFCPLGRKWVFPERRLTLRGHASSHIIRPSCFLTILSISDHFQEIIPFVLLFQLLEVVDVSWSWLVRWLDLAAALSFVLVVVQSFDLSFDSINLRFLPIEHLHQLIRLFFRLIIISESFRLERQMWFHLPHRQRLPSRPLLAIAGIRCRLIVFFITIKLDPVVEIVCNNYILAHVLQSFQEPKLKLQKLLLDEEPLKLFLSCQSVSLVREHVIVTCLSLAVLSIVIDCDGSLISNASCCLRSLLVLVAAFILFRFKSKREVTEAPAGLWSQRISASPTLRPITPLLLVWLMLDAQVFQATQALEVYLPWLHWFQYLLHFHLLQWLAKRSLRVLINFLVVQVDQMRQQVVL